MRYLLAVPLLLSFLFTFPAQSSVAPLFHVENFTCGTNNDWKDMSLQFDEDGNVIVSNVSFGELWEEHKMGDSGVLKEVSWKMSLTVMNDTDMRLPIWISSTVRLVYNGNLNIVGYSKSDWDGNPDYDMKLLSPGKNRININNSSAIGYSAPRILEEHSTQPIFGCLSIGIAVE